MLKTENKLHQGPEFLREILGDYKLNAQGLVVSTYGAPAQGWHVDSSHLFDMAHLPLFLPCHFVTVFCPLYDMQKVHRQMFEDVGTVWNSLMF